MAKTTCIKAQSVFILQLPLLIPTDLGLWLDHSIIQYCLINLYRHQTG